LSLSFVLVRAAAASTAVAAAAANLFFYPSSSEITHISYEDISINVVILQWSRLKTLICAFSLFLN